MTLLKSHVAVWATIATHLVTNPKSITYVKNRGDTLDFFTKELPMLGKALQAGLSTGILDLSGIPFKTRSKTDARPRFLFEFFKEIFDKDGYLLAFPRKVRETRQLTMMFYKFEMPISPEQERLAKLKFIVTDCKVKTSNWPDTLEEVCQNFQSLLPDDPMDIRPHHSSGATFDKLRNDQKRTHRSWFPLLMGTFGLCMFFPAQASMVTLTSTGLKIDQPRTQMARIAFVPKDSRGPRTIAIESHEPMMVQKGLQQLLYDHIEDSSPARGRINFTDQSINRRLAQKGSITGNIATIDLKDASDMVSYSLIMACSPPVWREALTACRSNEVMIDGFTRPIKKFASMGSALCFPIEAMIFWSICRTITDDVYVYGDDIITPANKAVECIKALEAYGLIVNQDKSFITGRFRESCGGDYLDGKDIGYIKCKSYAHASFVPFLNNISEMYGEQIADKLAGEYETRMSLQLFREPIQHRVRAQPFVYYTTLCAASHVFFERRYNKNIQTYEYRTLQEVHDSVQSKDRTYTDDMMYFDWLCQAMPDNCPVDYHADREYIKEFNPDFTIRYTTNVFETDPIGSVQQVANPVTKFVWGVRNPVS